MVKGLLSVDMTDAARGEDGDARRSRTGQDEKKTRECIAPHVHRQLAESDLKRELFRACRGADCRHHAEGDATQGTRRRQFPRDKHKPDAHGPQGTCEPDEAPQSDGRNAGSER